MHEGKINAKVTPATFQARLLPREFVHRRVLGLDLGTNCGVAVADVPLDPGDIRMLAGIWDLSIGPYDAGPIRHLRLMHFLALTAPDLIVYENVRYTPPHDQLPKLSPSAILARATPAIEFLGGLKVTVTSWAEKCGIPTQGLEISDIKRWATGKGNASKQDMIQAANDKYGLQLSLDEKIWKNQGDDNIADASHCCSLGINYYEEGLWATERTATAKTKKKAQE